MDDIGIQILIGRLMVPGQYPSSWLPTASAPLLSTSHHHLHLEFITPPFSTPRYNLHLSTNSQGYSLPSVYIPLPIMSQLLARQISDPLRSSGNGQALVRRELLRLHAGFHPPQRHLPEQSARAQLHSSWGSLRGLITHG